MLEAAVAIGFLALVGFLYWLIEVWHPRHAMRQAHDQTVKEFRLRYGPDWKPPGSVER